ncbi:MAG: hypothetical protein KJ578_12380 [Bacteroidetes bacterium]|nr:hypothetical protein [Bacteroidota bacterium]MBU1578777.1 hypothetical protein [Bacteroidota bacterium]MBU2558568.1 hypothetical protein [Bacteroidota bacterium]
MKKIIAQLVLVIGLFLSSQAMLAQGPPEPPDGHGETTNQDPGGGAPIGGGLGILLALGAAYGGRKVYKAWQQNKLEE